MAFEAQTAASRELFRRLLDLAKHGPPVPLAAACPASLIGIAMALLLFASARPMARVTLPADYMTLIMAMDVSRSMLAEDVEPSRMKAAQKAAKEFLQDLPKNVRVGIVSFAGNAQVVQHVSQDKDELVAAIDRFQLQRAQLQAVDFCWP